MRSSARKALPTVLILLCFAVSLFAQSPAKPPAAKAPGGSVSGRVTIKDKPAVGVLVVLRKSEGYNPYEPVMKGLTDQVGNYRIANVSPGSYLVTPTTPAFIPADSVTRKSVTIIEEDNVEGINFSLVRGGVITGKVTDADGKPVIQQQVELYRADQLDQRPQAPLPPQQAEQPQQQQRPPIYPTRNAQTDDRGVYRMFGLLPGKYKVSAGRSENSMMAFSISPVTYSQVFYPEGKDPAKATVIEVTEGSEANNVDITLGPQMQMFSVSGRIINSDNGAPVPQVRFGLHRITGDRTDYMNHNAQSDARGDFTMEGLTPGKYGIFLFTNASTELRAERTTFDVVDQDVTGVTIKLIKGASVTGNVFLETEDKAAHRKLLEMRLYGYVQSFPGTSTSAASPIGPDGSFRLTGLPSGAAEFQIFPAGGYMPTGFVIQRIERDGVAVNQLEVKDGETVAGVKIFVKIGNASIRGVVTFENGTPPPGLRVVVRLSKPGESLRYIRQVEIDLRGQFIIDNLTAGTYELRPGVFGANNARVLETKKEVTLTEGSVTNVTLSLDVSTLKL